MVQDILYYKEYLVRDLVPFKVGPERIFHDDISN